MKRIFLFLLAAASFISCKNKTTDNKNNNSSNTSDSKSRWAANEEEKFMDKCVKKPGDDKGGTKAQCSCVLEKAEKYFSTYEVYDRMSEDNPQWQKNGNDFRKATDECREISSAQKENNNNNNNSSSGSWSDDDIAKYKKVHCKEISFDACSCKLGVAMKYSKSLEEYSLLAIKNNDPNSSFWKEFQECVDKYSRK